MSVINVRCDDQLLTVTGSPVIASGGINSDFVKFIFDGLWDGYTKTAIFYRNENEVYRSLVGSDSRCVIPHEVMAAGGTIFFGVFGVKGDVTRTSEVMTYNIVQGAITTGTITPDPTPDIYAQILADIGKAKITGATINASGHLIISKQDGTTYDAGNAKGEKGEQGDPGQYTGDSYTKKVLAVDLPASASSPSMLWGYVVLGHRFLLHIGQDNANFKAGHLYQITGETQATASVVEAPIGSGFETYDIYVELLDDGYHAYHDGTEVDADDVGSIIDDGTMTPVVYMGEHQFYYTGTGTAEGYSFVWCDGKKIAYVRFIDGGLDVDEDVRIGQVSIGQDAAGAGLWIEDHNQSYGTYGGYTHAELMAIKEELTEKYNEHYTEPGGGDFLMVCLSGLYNYSPRSGPYEVFFVGKYEEDSARPYIHFGNLYEDTFNFGVDGVLKRVDADGNETITYAASIAFADSNRPTTFYTEIDQLTEGGTTVVTPASVNVLHAARVYYRSPVGYLQLTAKNVGAAPKTAQVTEGTNITLVDNTEYRLTDVTTLTLSYPSGSFEVWMHIETGETAPTITLPPTSAYIGKAPSFGAGETWELSIKDGTVVAQQVGDGA